jgi:methylenetetrahydrofolate dehydrogenase (NADP+)/methenyltetrahydrofolate cyclohydrolase
MTARNISGKEVSAQVYDELRVRIAEFKQRHDRAPHITVVIVGEDPASQTYVRLKHDKAQELGIGSTVLRMPADTTEEALLGVVDGLNRDPAVNGLLVQLPLPGHIDERRVLLSVDPAKDVDGFHPMNVGRMVMGDPGVLLPCTPHGILQLLLRSGVTIEGSHVVIVGRSNIVGKPLANLLIQKRKGGNATVTVCHTRTRDLGAITRTADILVAAAGSVNMITADMVRPGAVVVDVGTNRVPDPSSPRGSRQVGDVDFERVREVASAITPSPGGVGPMTVAMLMWNTVEAAWNQLGR